MKKLDGETIFFTTLIIAASLIGIFIIWRLCAKAYRINGISGIVTLPFELGGGVLTVWGGCRVISLIAKKIDKKDDSQNYKKPSEAKNILFSGLFYAIILLIGICTIFMLKHSPVLSYIIENGKTMFSICAS